MHIGWFLYVTVGIGTLQYTKSSAQLHTRPGYQQQLSGNNLFKLGNQPTYVIIASKLMRPGSVYAVSVSMLKSAPHCDIHASIALDGTEVASANKVFEPGDTETVLLKVPQTSIPGNYVLRVDGTANDVIGSTFNHTAELQLVPRFLTMIIHLNRPVFNCYSVVLIRVLIFTLDMKPYGGAVNINILDPKGYVMTGYPAVQLNTGVGTASYTMPEYSVTGWWAVQVDAFGQVEEKPFLVEKFDIPKTEIFVFTNELILSHETSFSGSLMALYGTNSYVQGNATIRIYADKLGQSEQIGSGIPLLEEVLEPFTGLYEFEYQLADLHYDINALVGKVIRLEVVVHDQIMHLSTSGYGSIYVMDSRVYLQFVGSADKTFKPGMPFTTFVTVAHNNAVPVSEDRLQGSSLTVTASVITTSGDRRILEIISDQFPAECALKITVDTPANSRYLILNAMYEDREGLVSSEMVASSFVSSNNRTMHVHLSASPVQLGHFAIAHVRADFFMESFTYVIISKGLILLSGVEEMDLLNRPIKTMSIPVSSEMVPSFRILVYHVTLDGQIISDSVTVPVKSVNAYDLKVRVTKTKDKSGTTVEFGLEEGPSGSVVGFAAQDFDTFCHKCGADLTPAMVLENLYDFDDDQMKLPSKKWVYPDLTPDKITFYESPDWARDDASVFERAGVLVLTDATISQSFDRCSLTPGFRSCMDGGCYPDNGTCDGVKHCANSHDEKNCVPELDWEAMKSFRIYRKNRVGQFFDLPDGDWAWAHFNTDIFDYKSFPVPNRPSNWLIFAFRTDTKLGLNILDEPIYYGGVKPFFINVDMPTYCKRGEQIGIRIDAFNNQGQGIFIVLALLASEDYKFVHVEDDGYVNSYEPRTTFGEHQHQIWVEPNSITTVYMPIVATKIGEVEVTIEARAAVALDSATFTLLVEPDGVSQTLHTSVLLDLKNQPQTLKFLNINITESPIIPYSQWRMYIFDSPKARVSVVGDVFGPCFHAMPVTVDLLVRKPEQCAEPILFAFGANLWSLHYLRLTNQLTKSKLADALVQLNYYYAYLMMFQNDDGSFAMWKGFETSVWLTAGVVRVFQQSRFSDWENDLAVDVAILVEAMDWLLNYQSPDGAFVEMLEIPLNPRMHTRSPQNLKAHPKYNNIPLTAFVLITLCEVGNIPGDIRVRIKDARSRATRYLEKRLGNTVDPYELAIVTYALTLAGSVEGEMAFQKLDSIKKEQEGNIYWSTENSPLTEIYLDNQRPFLQAHRPAKEDALSVEATAYGLLVYVAREGLLQENIVRWLNTMRTTDGGFISTQDSLVAMQALTEFSFRARLRDITNMRVRMSASSAGVIPVAATAEDTVEINGDNLAQLQTIEIANPWGHVDVIARGSGMAILQLDVSYSIDYAPLLIPPARKAFDLFMNVKYEGRNNSIAHFLACQRWTLQELAPTSGVAIFEMDLPTGYYQYQPFLDAFVETRHIPNLRALYVTQNKVYAFFRLLDEKYTCLNFTLERWWPVANLSHYIKAKVYDYYSPELYNETIFETYTMYMLDICQVCGSYQCPYCFYYSNTQRIGLSFVLAACCFVITLIMQCQWQSSLSSTVSRSNYSLHRRSRRKC